MAVCLLTGESGWILPSRKKITLTRKKRWEQVRLGIDRKRKKRLSRRQAPRARPARGARRRAPGSPLYCVPPLAQRPLHATDVYRNRLVLIQRYTATIRTKPGSYFQFVFPLVFLSPMALPKPRRCLELLCLAIV